MVIFDRARALNLRLTNSSNIPALHRTGAVESDERDDFFNMTEGQLTQEIPHPGRFQLEQPNRF